MAKHHSLPNGCWCSEIQVHPKNWRSGGPSLLKKEWYIHYRFYDPQVKDEKGKVIPKQRKIKRVNSYQTLADRRSAIEYFINLEWKILKERGYNPITDTFMAPLEIDYEIHPSTKFIDALEMAFKKIKAEKNTLTDMKSILKYFYKSIKLLRFDEIPISKINRKHIRLALDNCGNTSVKKYWSPNRFNHYRNYISMVFKQLVELEAIDYNPVHGIAKEKVVKKLRTLLTFEERKKIDEQFAKVDTYYRRFLHIFFHSGARPKELTFIKKEDIDLNGQRFKVVVKKGKSYREEHRVIKNMALPFWIEAYNEAMPGEYIFGKYLKPGPKPATRDYITKKWHRIVKDEDNGLGIKADLYSLKHSNLDETAAELDINAAAQQAGHTTPVITLSHYAIGEKDRFNNRLKEVKNKFA